MIRSDETQHEGALTTLVDVGLALQRLNKTFEQQLGLSIVQWCVLHRLLDLPAASALLLAHAVGVTPGTLTQSLGRLKRKGLVYVGEDPRDARRKSIAVTRDGRDAVVKASRFFRESLAKVVALRAELEAVRDALRNVPAEDPTHRRRALGYGGTLDRTHAERRE